MLDANKITIVHLGLKEDPPLMGVYDLRGKTTILQANYLIGRSLLSVGGDSFFAHNAGWRKRPLLAIYGITAESPHGPFWRDPSKTSIIESHRWGGVPNYSLQEPVKTVNLIDPYHIANEVLRLLGITHTFNQQSRFWGLLYQHTILELIPNTVPDSSFLPELPMLVRMDYLHNEDNLVKLLQTGRRINLLTSKMINLGILSAFKSQILSYNHEIGTLNTELPTIEYIGQLKPICPRSVFFTREQDPAKVSDLRFPYFPDSCMIEQVKDTTREDYLLAALNYLNKKDTPDNRLVLEEELQYSKFRTTRYVLSEGSVYLSHAHRLAGKIISNLNDNIGEIIDDPLFFKDLNHLSIWYEPRSNSSSI